MIRTGSINHAPNSLESRVNRLADEYRARCLWFLRPDFYPETLEERLRVLDYIQRHGDLTAFRRAGELRGRLLGRYENGASGE